MDKKKILGIVLLSCAGLVLIVTVILFYLDSYFLEDIFRSLIGFLEVLTLSIIITLPILGILITVGAILIVNSKKKKNKNANVNNALNTCPICHKENKLGAKYCAHCGALLETKVCSSCGKENVSDALYCSSCGKELNK